MKGWFGTLLAAAVCVIALTINPAQFTGHSGQTMDMAFAAGLLLLTSVAFLLARDTSPLELSRHVASWMCGLAIAAIIAANFNQFKPRKTADESTTVKANLSAPAKHTTKKRPAAEVYHPDTPKLERVERIVEIDNPDPLAPPENKRYKVKNLLSKKDSSLPEGWQPSEEEKQAFKKYLESQGLKYDPETAFSFPPDSDASGDEADFSIR